jgi:cytochrome b
MTSAHSVVRLRVWDLPTRVFHILLVVSVMGLVISGEIGGDAMRIHFWLGYAVLTLLFFRFVWGLVGGHWSRFVHFVPTPSKLTAYLHALRHQPTTPHVGHNPLGALSVLAMLSILLLQVFSGFMSDDEISNSGPWTALIPGDWVALATEYHGEVGKAVLLTLIGLHVATVLYYKYVKKDDLISPMLHGDKNVPEGTPASRDTISSRLFAIGVLLGCAYGVYRLVQLGGSL